MHERASIDAEKPPEVGGSLSHQNCAGVGELIVAYGETVDKSSLEEHTHHRARVEKPPPVTRLNWNRPSLRRSSVAYGLPQRPKKHNPFGFPARYAGTCQNCQQRFPVGALVKFNSLDELVHGRGCPKSSKRSPLAG